MQEKRQKRNPQNSPLPMRGMYIRNGFLEYSYPEYAKKRSQDIETMYYDSGQFYCIKTKVFLEKKH